MQNNILPTREDCLRIVKTSDKFYCTEKVIQGYKVEMYDYRLASPSDFTKYNAYELRGLTFIENEGKWDRYIMMQKFFNINETSHEVQGKNYSTMYFDLLDRDISSVLVKEDGSCINFIKLPNGNIVAKSKMSFDSVQAEMSNKLYNSDKNLKLFIDEMLNADIMPIFELVSPMNQIVLPYNDTELRLLQIRNNSTGKYLNSDDVLELSNKYGIKYTNRLDNIKDLYTLTEMQKSETKCEGWVVTLSDGLMVKIKTDWYFQNHGLMTNNTKADLLVQIILDDTIDDVISIAEGEKKRYFREARNLIQDNFNKLVQEFKDLKSVLKTYESRKEFALKYNKHFLFNYVMRNVPENMDLETEARDSIKKYISYNCRRQSDAEKYLSKLGFNIY